MTTESTTDEAEWQRYGTHVARFEPPDIVLFRANGDIKIDDVRCFLSDLLKWPRPERGFFYISDVSRMGHQSGQVVREMQTLPPDIFRAVSVVGAKFHQRVAADLLRRVTIRLNLLDQKADMQYFATEADARAAIDSIRARK